MTSANVELIRRSRGSVSVEGLVETDFSIKGLEDFRTIADFDESADTDTISVISHPGWKSHHKNTNKKYKDLRRYWTEELGREAPDTHGRFRVALLTVHDKAMPLYYPYTRHMILESILFQFLAEQNIPTIVTVPTVRRVEDYERSREELELLTRQSTSTTEVFNFILRQEKFFLSSAVSENLGDYLRDIRRNRDNFYLVSTDQLPGDEEHGLARGYLLGDYNYRNLEREVVAKFLEIVDGRKVLFAGSDIPGCIDCTLGYFRYVDCDVKVLTNYLSISDKVDFGEFEDHIPRVDKPLDYVLTHPQERIVSGRLLELFEEKLKSIDVKVSENPFYKPSKNSKIEADTRYV